MRETVEASLLDPGVQDCPYALYRLLRDEHPVYRMPSTGFFVVSRLDDVMAVMNDPVTFSNHYEYADVISDFDVEVSRTISGELRSKGWPHCPTLQRSDPPAHARYRKLVNRLFTPRQIRTLTPGIVDFATRLIDSFIDRGSCEFVGEFAGQLPALVTAWQLGLDEDVTKLKRWTDGMLAPLTRKLDGDQALAAVRAEIDAQHYFSEVLAARRWEPADDIMSWLVADHGEDEPLTEAELQSILRQLVTGGLETTANALAHGLLLLIDHPHEQAELRRDRSRLAAFIEETLRIEGPVQGLFRRATQDVQLRGVRIPEGSLVMIRHGAANHDPHTFPDPERFDIDRPNLRRHVAFGFGIHSCVGAPLAREEMRVAFELILDRMHDLRLAAPLPTPAHVPSLMFRPLKELNVAFKGT